MSVLGFSELLSTSKFQLLVLPVIAFLTPLLSLKSRFLQRSSHVQALDYSLLAIRPASHQSAALSHKLRPRCSLMPAVTTPTESPRPSLLPKMEDRKRPALSTPDDLAPPAKKVAINGSKTKDDGPEMKEEGWVEVRLALSYPCCKMSAMETSKRFFLLYQCALRYL